MLRIVDILTDDSDDIIISGDILEDQSNYDSTIKNVERRVVARYDDFVYDDIASGIERYIQQAKTPITINSIVLSISDALMADKLLNRSDFQVITQDTNDRKLQVLIKFTNPYIGRNNLFRVIVDIENQRVYRG